MGQFYKGTEATFIDDAMFKLPYELMGTVIDKKDKEIQTDIDARSALADLLKAQGLKSDEPRLQQKIKQYQDEIDASVNDIYKDPMNYNREGVQRLKRKINEDWTLGEVAAIQSNKAGYDAWVKDEEEKIKKDPSKYAPGQFDALKAEKLAEFDKKGGTSYQDANKYNTFATEDSIGMKDTLTILDDLMKGAVQDKDASVSWNNDKGGWNVKGKHEEKFYTPQMLQESYKGFLATNPDYIQGVSQRERLALPGWQGNFTPEGAPSMEVGSHFGDSMRLLQTKYGGKHIVDEGGRTMNEIGVQEKKDEMETVYVDKTLTGTEQTIHTSYAGKDNTTFNTNWAKNNTTKDNSINTGLQILADRGGYSSVAELTADPKMKTQVAAIRGGNFGAISKQAAGASVAREYKAAELRQKALRSTMAQFKKDTGLNATDPKASKQWNEFLGKNYINATDSKMTWEPTGLVKKEMDNIAKYVIDNGLHMSTPVTLPAGFKIAGKDVGGNKMTMNDLISNGFVLVEKKEAGKSGGTTTAAGTTIGQVITYTDGVNTLNFSTGQTGVVPIWAQNDSNQMEFGLKVNINGKEVTGRIGGINTKSVENIQNSNEGKRMKTQRFLNKLGSVEYTFPGGPTYYGADVFDAKGKRIRKKGDVVFNGRTMSSSDKDVQDVLGDFID